MEFSQPAAAAALLPAVAALAGDAAAPLQRGLRLLHVAAFAGDLATTERLLAANPASAMEADWDGRTALHWALPSLAGFQVGDRRAQLAAPGPSL